MTRSGRFGALRTPMSAGGGSGRVAMIAFAELLCTSLWFSANSAAQELRAVLSLSPAGVGWLTNSVQFGFIAGTLMLSLSGLADRFAASRIFVVSSLIGAGANAVFAFLDVGLASALAARFVVGLSLAGIYPIGMKLIIGWTRGGTGLTLALLVGMLTLGTALPHGIRGLDTHLAWQGVVAASSVLALAGGILVWLCGDGPNLESPATRSSRERLLIGVSAFKSARFRAAAFGYFGHMWELYAFWTLAPLLVAVALPELVAGSTRSASQFAFLVIAVGALGSWLGGLISRRWGSARVAFLALATSGAMCALFPWVVDWAWPVKLACLLVWGASVVADSAQFSSISGEACARSSVGSALSIQNSIGFFITTVAIALTSSLFASWGAQVSWLLLPGPVLGLLAMRRLVFVAPPTPEPVSNRRTP